MGSVTKIDPSLPIAVVGMACRFPGEATNPSKFWEMLKNGRDAYSPNADRYNTSAFYHGNASARQNVIPTRGGHFLTSDPYHFDAAFFNITGAEAVAMDPKQRIALEVGYEALENAGLGPRRLAGTKTAVFMGSTLSDYRDSVIRDFAQHPKYYLVGMAEEMISNRISHFFDLRGPSATVATACSSSLVTVHLACQSLRNGESESALAGGIGLVLTPDGTMQLHNLSVLSSEGRSRSFDESADGYARGEGCGIVVLKPLEVALRDGDPIRAVIRGSGVNSDGWTKGVMLPSGEAQAELVKHVYETNGLDYGSTQYVEAHGTGTNVGDPIEAAAIHRTLGQGASNNRRLFIGSVKPNIGHLEPAAGVAGFIKTVLALENNLIPPNILFSRANPEIPLDEWNMMVPTKPTPWPAAPVKRASVSSFGMGGTNGHVVLEAFQPVQHHHSHRRNVNACSPDFHENRKRLFVFSSHDQAGFARIGTSLLEHFDTHGATALRPDYLKDLAHTLATARFGLGWKASCIASDIMELRVHLSSLSDIQATRPMYLTSPRVGLVFTGQGAQWPRMGIELFHRPVFRASIAQSSTYLKQLGCTWDPKAELARGALEGSRLGTPDISQPICTVLQIALVDELRAWGVQPTKIVGHSSGEIAAAYCIGALTHRDAIVVAYFRGKSCAGLKVAAPHLKGGMMAVGCTEDEIKKILLESEWADVITVACVNAPSSLTLSGDLNALQGLEGMLKERQIFARLLQVDMAYHSPQMKVVARDYSSLIADIEPISSYTDGMPHMISSVTGEEISPEMLGPYYWLRNLLSPVQFADAVRELVRPPGSQENTVDVLVEIGPHSTLRGPVEQTLSHYDLGKVTCMAMLLRNTDAAGTALQVARDLLQLGTYLDIAAVNGDTVDNAVDGTATQPQPKLLIDLPPYPWKHDKKYSAVSRLQKELMWRQNPTHSLLGAKMPSLEKDSHVWRGLLRLDDEPWLRGHKVGTTVLLPGAGMCSMALEAGRQLVEAGKHAYRFRLRDVCFTAALALPEDTPVEVLLTLRPHQLGTTGAGAALAAWFEFTLASSRDADQSLRENCHGLLAIEYEEGRSPQMVAEEAQAAVLKRKEYERVSKECDGNKPISKQNFYKHIAKSGFDYGGLFQGVENVVPGIGMTTFGIRVFDVGETFSLGQSDDGDNLIRSFLLSGATLDAVFQDWMGSTLDARSGKLGFDKPFAPTYIGEMDVNADFPWEDGCLLPGFCTSRRHGFNELSSDSHLFDAALEKIYLSVRDFRISLLDDSSGDHAERTEGAGRVGLGDLSAMMSEVRWDYSLDVMLPHEAAKIVAGPGARFESPAATDVQVMIRLIHLALHQAPASTVIELVLDEAGLDQALIDAALTHPGWPRGAVPSSHVRYAVVSSASSTGEKPGRSLYGTEFALGISEEPSFADARAAADLLIIPASIRGCKSFDEIILQTMEFLHAEATILFVDDDQSEAESAFSTKGFDSCFSIPTRDGNTVRLLRRQPQSQSKIEHEVKQQPNFVILEPSSPSAAIQSFSEALKGILFHQDLIAVTIPWATINGSNTFTGKAVISLVELEQPLISSLSEADFNRLRSVVLQSERLLWVTHGPNPFNHVIDGLARCISSELANSFFQVLHLSEIISSSSLNHGPALVARLITRDTKDKEFREVGDGVLQVNRIFKNMDSNDSLASYMGDSTRTVRLKDQERPLRLTIRRPGLLDTLHFVDNEHVVGVLGLEDIEIEVRTAGMNFKDVMAAMGLLPMSTLGLEASGTVLAVGPTAASHFAPGDRVAVFQDGCHATRVRCNFRRAIKIPDAMNFEEASSIPITHATAYHSLVNLARLRKGQSILIHAAAGGVGQAAIQLAKYLGLVIYATVGSEDKRRLLVDEYSMPDASIFYSRDASFVKGLERVTKGRGVDCILNSLSGELLRASWGCLAPFGTFIELGLRDITDNTRLDMRHFRDGTTFTSCNMSILPRDQLAIVLKCTFDFVAQGVFRPAAPLTVVPISRVADAYRTMQQGKHRGKLVLTFEKGEEKAPVLFRAIDSGIRMEPRATYLLVGGLGGLGRCMAEEFVAAGARYIAFLSRSGDGSPAAKAVLESLKSKGAQVKVYRCDVADEDSFLAVMRQCAEELPPIKGVLQLAMVLQDIVFEKISYEQFVHPMRPKIQGTWNLHNYFDHTRPLDFFIGFSSVSCIWGYPSQAAYACGNAFIDGLAHYRRALGLAATSLNLGIIIDVGLVVEGAVGGPQLEQWAQVLGIREETFLAIMRHTIHGAMRGHLSPQITTGLGTADIWAEHCMPQPYYFADPRFGALSIRTTAAGYGGKAQQTSEGREPMSKSLATALASATSPEQAAQIMTDALVWKTAEILQMSAAEVDTSLPLYRYGIDSLTAIELRNWISREAKANIALLEVVAAASIRDFGAQIAEKSKWVAFA